MDEELHSNEQAERCRRLARQINDSAARDALERLALEYESSVNQLPPSDEDWSGVTN